MTLDLSKLPIYEGTAQERVDRIRHTRQSIINEGRLARRVGIRRDHPNGQFADPGMTLDWANGWRWEDEEIRAAQEEKK